MIFPIIDLEKKDSSWKSSYIRCLKGGVPLEFGISENKMLKVEKINLDDFCKYIKKQEDKVKKIGKK